MALRKIFVTTALPYANSHFHIGHIMEYIQADIWVRFQRMQGHQVHFVCADDTHGAPIMLNAEKQGITPEQLIEKVAADHQADWPRFYISFDHWHSTHSPENVELSQGIYKKLKAARLVSSKEIEQFFDPIKGMFLPDRYIKGECPKCGTKDQYGDSCENCGAVYAPTDLKKPYSTITGALPVLKKSEHFFFKLSDKKCVDFLQKWTAETPLQSEVVNKLAEWLGDGGKNLNDWDISRDAPYFGIDIPDAPGKYFYVWLDAPVGYLASLKAYFALGKAKLNGEKRSFEDFLADDKVEQYHFIGKDIVYFHTLFWPAMLKFAERKVPNNVFVHGFITFSGEKMSKSRGTGISPQKYLGVGMNPEWLRYYIAAKLNANVEDLDFNPDDFLARVNSDLIGKYVNIASRCAGFISKRFNGEIKLPAPNFDYGDIAFATAPGTLIGKFQKSADAIAKLYEAREFGKAIREIMALADMANQFVDSAKPWDMAKQADAGDKLQVVCSISLNLFRLLTLYLKPVLPKIAEQVETFLQIGPMEWSDCKKVLDNHVIKPYTHLMTRIDPKQIHALLEPPIEPDKVPAKPDAKTASLPAAEESATPSGEFSLVSPELPKPVFIPPLAEMVSIDDFSRIDLRVVKILDAELVPEAEKLLRLTLDLGTTQRTVFAGIRAAYTPRDLIGRLTIMVANLAPRKMRFGESQGMVLAAGDGSGGIYLLAPDSGAVPGMRIK